MQAVIGVDNFRFASQRIAMTSLRSIIGRHELDNLLAHREDVNNELRTATIAAVDPALGRRGPPGARCATSPAARAAAGHGPPGRGRAGAPGQGHRRHGRARGEPGAGRGGRPSCTESPGAMQLRALQTLAEVASEHNSTLVFPIPIELLRASSQRRRRHPVGIRVPPCRRGRPRRPRRGRRPRRRSRRSSRRHHRRRPRRASSAARTAREPTRRRRWHAGRGSLSGWRRAAPAWPCPSP